MKPDIKLFKKLSDDAYFQAWYEHIIGTLGGTGMGELCDPFYIPPSDEMASFQNKSRWLYTVLMNVVHTQDGKQIIRRHRRTQDGRAVLYELFQNANDAAATEISAEEMMTDLVTLKLDNGWTKPIKEFIVGYIEKMDLYNEIVEGTGQRLSDPMKKAFLERAVVNSRTLREVKIREIHRVAEGHSKLSYMQYANLLKNAAKIMDKQ